MKKFASFLLFILFGASLYGQTVKFSSASPEQGKTLKFVYDPKGGNLDRIANITCQVKAIFSRDFRMDIPVKLTKVGNVYQGEFTPRDSTNLAVLVFSADGTQDENPAGYYTKFYKNGNATSMALFLEGYLHASLGSSLAKIKRNQEKALALYKEAFDIDTALGNRYLNNYLLTQFTIDKIKGKQLVYETIAQYNKLVPSEKNAIRIAQFYMIINDSKAKDSVNNLIKTTYPKGAYALANAITNLKLFKEADKKEERFHQILTEFNLGLDKKEDLKKLNWAFMGLAEAFYSSQNNAKLGFYLDKHEPKLTRAIVYNKFAAKNALAKQNLEFSEVMSKKSLELIDSLEKQEMPSYYSSREEYMMHLEDYRATHNLTYIKILSLLNRNSEALFLASEAARKTNFGSGEMNAMYVDLLAKNGKAEEVVKFATQFTRANQGTEKMKAEFKAAYKGTIPFEEYFADLKKQAYTQQKEKFVKEMINIPAFKFSLKNVKGEIVDLAKLKGKVVVVDYWATWCGPCLMSFPGMQMAVNKYKNDPNVVFLFINTWERGENSVQNVKDWVAANPKYTFNVLLDRKSATDPEDFEVVNNYKVSAIPTKFIIDGAGNIRFKKVGTEIIPEAIVKELDIMIELAKYVDRELAN